MRSSVPPPTSTWAPSAPPGRIFTAMIASLPDDVERVSHDGEVRFGEREPRRHGGELHRAARDAVRVVIDPARRIVVEHVLVCVLRLAAESECARREWPRRERAE